MIKIICFNFYHILIKKIIDYIILIQDSLKGEIVKLEKEYSNIEKQLVDTKANLLQQLKIQETEYKQKIENAKLQHDENYRRLEQEKVIINNFLNVKLSSLNLFNVYLFLYVVFFIDD